MVRIISSIFVLVFLSFIGQVQAQTMTKEQKYKEIERKIQEKKFLGRICTGHLLDIYADVRPNKVFAISKRDPASRFIGCGYKFAENDIETARNGALGNCERNNRTKEPCFVLMENDEMVVEPEPQL